MKQGSLRKFLTALVLLIAVGQFAWDNYSVPVAGTAGTEPAATALSRAIAEQQNDVQVRGSGRVTRVLPDDNDGSRHQRFILQLSSGDTLLVAHNIDLAPRVAQLRTGDTVEFFGEYEWTPQGGVIHWTHHDPRGRHVGGWLQHNGVLYD